MFLAEAKKQSGWCYDYTLPDQARLVNADVTAGRISISGKVDTFG